MESMNNTPAESQLSTFCQEISIQDAAGTRYLDKGPDFSGKSQPFLKSILEQAKERVNALEGEGSSTAMDERIRVHLVVQAAEKQMTALLVRDMLGRTDDE